MSAGPLTDAIITPHARIEIERRGLDESVVRRVMESPEQEAVVRSGRLVLQSRVSMGAPARTYLVRVFVDVDRRPPEVVTVHRTSKITKYWREVP